MTLNPPFLSSMYRAGKKSAEIRFSKVLANELAPHNIRVNCVIPGFIHTPERFAKWEREMAKRPLSAQDAERERTRVVGQLGHARHPRWGKPEEIANLIVFAVSDAAEASPSMARNSWPITRWTSRRWAKAAGCCRVGASVHSAVPKRIVTLNQNTAAQTLVRHEDWGRLRPPWNRSQ